MIHNDKYNYQSIVNCNTKIIIISRRIKVSSVKEKKKRLNNRYSSAFVTLVSSLIDTFYGTTGANDNLGTIIYQTNSWRGNFSSKAQQYFCCKTTQM